MMHLSMDVWIGIGLALIAGVMAGNSMLPMKFAKRWSWENTWLVFSVVSLVVIPWCLAVGAVDNLSSVYRSLSVGQLAVPFLFGAGWGIAQVLFGLSIARLGLALGYAIIIGLGTVGGTLVPLIFQHREVLLTGKGLLILSGLVIMVAGIVAASWAGNLREKHAGAKAIVPGRDTNYGASVLLAVICGLMAPMLNYSLAFGQSIAEEAVRQGATAANASYAVWPVGLAGGLIPNAAYSVYLLWRNHTWSNFRHLTPGVYWAALMGGLWMGAVATYGVSTTLLGALGTSIGWALFQIFMIMAANVSGVVTGEWKGARQRARNLLWASLLLLALATVIIALANR